MTGSPALPPPCAGGDVGVAGAGSGDGGGAAGAGVGLDGAAAVAFAAAESAGLVATDALTVSLTVSCGFSEVSCVAVVVAGAAAGVSFDDGVVGALADTSAAGAASFAGVAAVAGVLPAEDGAGDGEKDGVGREEPKGRSRAGAASGVLEVAFGGGVN